MSIDTSATQRAQDADAVEAPRTSGQAIWPIVMMREIVVTLRDRNFVVGTVVTLAAHHRRGHRRRRPPGHVAGRAGLGAARRRADPDHPRCG